VRLSWRSALAVAASVAAVAVISLPRADAAAPPYEPDPNAVGTLSFYNASGVHITTGSINAKPIAAYVVGSNAIRSGDVTAALFAAQPNPAASNPALWNVDQPSAFTDYPLAAGPVAIKTLSLTHPVVSGASTDLSLADFISEFPNTSGALANLYQFRIKTADASGTQTTAYLSADVLVSGATWTQVYPDPALTQTTTALVAAPSPATVGQKVTLTATVSPAGTSGSVQFRDGSTNIGSPVAVNASGVATTSTKALNQSVHQLFAVFTPTATATFAGSTGTVSEAVGVTATGSITGTLSGKIAFSPKLTNTASAGTVKYTFTATLAAVSGSTTQGTGTITGASIKATVTLPAGSTCNSYLNGGFVRGANAVTYATNGGPVSKTTLTFGSSVSTIAVPYTVTLASPTVVGSFATPSGSATHGTIVLDQTKTGVTSACAGAGLTSLAFTGKKGASTLTVG